MLYQLSYISLKTLERETGIEPATNSLEGCDSTTELLPPFPTLLTGVNPLSLFHEDDPYCKKSQDDPRAIEKLLVRDRLPCGERDQRDHRQRWQKLIQTNPGAQGRIRTSVAP